jgi:hypothetical protein
MLNTEFTASTEDTECKETAETISGYFRGGHETDGAQLRNSLQGRVQASEFFRFGVKSLDPIRNAVHLKSDVELRVSSCPRQELM